MNFLVQNGNKYSFSPFYSLKEQAFFSEPEAPGDISIMIKGGYTSLDVSSISSTIYCVSGLNPQKTWNKADLAYPRANQGLVKVIFDFNMQQGMGVDYAVDWKTFFDTNTGIVCICGSVPPHNTLNVEFTNNTIAGIDNGNLVAVWIKPTFVK